MSKENTNPVQKQYNEAMANPKATEKSKEAAAEKLNKQDTVNAKDFPHTATGNLKLEVGEKVIVDGQEKYIAAPTPADDKNWKTL